MLNTTKMKLKMNITSKVSISKRQNVRPTVKAVCSKIIQTIIPDVIQPSMMHLVIGTKELGVNTSNLQMFKTRRAIGQRKVSCLGSIVKHRL